MDILKSYGLLSLKYVAYLLIGSFIISFMYYFFISSKVVDILVLIYLIIGFIIFGFKEGKKAQDKGYIKGIKMSLLFILIMLIMNLILYRSPFKLSNIIFYVILIFSGTFGATLGINKKKN